MAEIQEMTGFQSPCTEYAEDELSLDQRFITDRPAMFFVRAKTHYPHFHIMKDDLLLIHRGREPKGGETVMAVVSNNFLLAKFQTINGRGVLMPINKILGDDENGEDFIWGVISSIHRSTVR
jgi:DNA polymerase V